MTTNEPQKTAVSQNTAATPGTNEPQAATAASTIPAPFNLAAALDDPISKSAIDAYTADRAASLAQELEELKQFKRRYQIGEDTNGQPVYMDPRAATATAANTPGTDRAPLDEAFEIKKNEAVERHAAAMDRDIIEPLRKQTAQQAQFIENLLVSRGLDEALATAGIKPALREAARLVITSNHEIETKENGSGGYDVVINARDGSPLYGQAGRLTLAELVSTWTRTEQGAAFLDVNHGYGSGSAGNPAGNPAGIRPVKSRAELRGYEEEAAFIKRFGRDAFYSLPRG